MNWRGGRGFGGKGSWGKGLGDRGPDDDERYGPDGPLDDDRTGNGIVNDGPDNERHVKETGGHAGAAGRAGQAGHESQPEREGREGASGSGGIGFGGGASGFGGGGLGSGLGDGLGGGLGGGLGKGGDDELALRRMLRGAVEDLEPSEGALDHLRLAVPARRARKRQAVVGIAAAVVLIGTAVPAFVHVATSGAISEDLPVNAGHGEQAQGGTGDETGEDGSGDVPGKPSTGPSAGESATPGTRKPEEAISGSTGGAGGGTVTPSTSYAVSSPVCEPGQLSVISAQAEKPDAEGKVYGTFRVSNVSGTECAVNGAGSVNFEAKGAADKSRISVVEHAAGDAASGLPDPSQEAQALVLKPDTAYEVKFAWVPTETCPTTGVSPDPTPPADAGGTTSGSTGTDTSSANTTTQLGTEDGTPQEGSVAVSHTAEPGAPAAEATIPNACAGTIYRTGVLDAS